MDFQVEELLSVGLVVNTLIDTEISKKNGGKYMYDIVTFRDAVYTGIHNWINDAHKNYSDNIELQFVCAKIAAGVKKVCAKAVTSPKEKLLMFYYTAVCMKILFELVRYPEDQWLDSSSTTSVRKNVLDQVD